MKDLYKLSQTAICCLALLFSAPSLLFSQSKRTLDAHPGTVIDSFTHGFYTSLPANYSTSGKKYPLLVFLHGIGEIGDGSAGSLPAVLRNGPPMQINQQVNNNVNANFPDPVVVNGQSFEFIVVCPQLNTWPWNGYEQIAVNDVINYAIRTYRIDTAKMYLTGLSMGGGIAWEYPGYSGPMYGKRLAGLLVVAGASSPSNERSAEIVKEHLPVWATCNSVDGTVPPSYTTQYVQILNSLGANPAPLITIFPDQGHGGWVKTYGAPNQPGVTNSAGQNVYQWMLQYRRVGDNVVLETGATTPLPTASAGIDQVITLPSASTTLTGTASQINGTIAGYQWTEVSGPNNAVFSNSTNAQTAVSGLVQGSYVFQFTVTNNAGGTATDQMTVIVNPATASVFTVNAGPDVTIIQPTSSFHITGAAATVKGELVATCSWTEVSGPNTASISGSGSISPTISNLVQGSYVIQVSLTSKSGKYTSDQMTLTVNPLTSGTFVASAGPDVSITLPTNSWKIAGTATVKGVTPASCHWKQVSGPSTASISGGGSITPTVSSLIEGAYVFEVDLVSTTGLTSSDQMKLTVNAAGTTASFTEVDASALGLDSTDLHPLFKLYPNPVPANQELAVEAQSAKTGTIKFTVYDRNGKLVKQVILENQSAYFRQTIPVTGLAKGTYVLAVSADGEKPTTFKFLIQ